MYSLSLKSMEWSSYVSRPEDVAKEGWNPSPNFVFYLWFTCGDVVCLSSYEKLNYYPWRYHKTCVYIKPIFTCKALEDGPFLGMRSSPPIPDHRSYPENNFCSLCSLSAILSSINVLAPLGHWTQFFNLLSS